MKSMKKKRKMEKRIAKENANRIIPLKTLKHDKNEEHEKRENWKNVLRKKKRGIKRQ